MLATRLWPAAVCVCSALSGSGFAQSAPAPGALPGLQASVSAPRALNDPSQPIWLHFSLQNTGDTAVEIPLTHPVVSDGVVLPAPLVTGTGDEPWLWITYESERPVPLRPAVDLAAIPAGTGAPAASQPAAVLRVGPRGAIGAMVDLRDIYRQAQYAGKYELEWKPFDGAIAPAKAEFRVEPRKNAVIVTDHGKMSFRLFYEKAPRNVENFLELAREGFYDGKTIHRVVPNYLIQGGCPFGDGTGMRPDGRTVPAEFTDGPVTAGTLAMARRPDDPNSASCQFFIALTELPELEGQYTVIGQAADEECLKTLQQIAQLPTDRNNRPARTLVIRSVNLIDPNADITRRHTLRATP